MTDNELTAIVEALTALASAVSWTQPNSSSSVSSYLKDAWAAIDALRMHQRGDTENENHQLAT